MSLIPSDNSQVVAQNLRVIWVYEFHNTTELGRVAAIVAASKADGLMVKMVKSDWPHFSRWHDELAIKLPIGVSLTDVPNDVAARSVPESVSMLWSAQPGVNYDKEVKIEDVGSLAAARKLMNSKSQNSTFYVSVPQIVKHGDRGLVPEVVRAISISKVIPVISGTTKDASPAHGRLVLCGAVSPTSRIAVSCSPYSADLRGLAMSGVTDFLLTIQPNMSAQEMSDFVSSVHNS